MMWITSGDADTICENCLPNDGEIMSYKERSATYGKMPGDNCLGGDMCMCSLVPVE
jgi:hypothetical protein